MITEAHSTYGNIFFHTEGDAQDANFISLKAAFQRLMDGGFSGLIASINQYAQRPLYITMDASIQSLEGKGSLATVIGAVDAPKPSYITSGHFVFMSPDDLDGDDVQGFSSDFTASFDRLFLHELFHVYDNLARLDQNGIVTQDPWISSQHGINFAEETAVFAENFLYTPTLGQTNADGGMRLGHANAASFPYDDYYSEGGASGTSGFTGFPMSRYVVDNGTSMVFTAQNTQGGTNTKTYYAPGYDLFGNGSPLTTYDHYIRYETYAGYTRFDDPSNVTTPSALTAMLPDVMFDDADGALKTVADVFASVNHLFDDYQTQSWTGHTAIRGYADRLGVTGPYVSATYADMQVARFVGIGADRWGDTIKDLADQRGHIDLSGPVLTGTAYPTSLNGSWAPETISASRLGINDQSATVGAVLAGASGFVLSNTVLPGSYVDATASSDWLIAGSGNDVIIMGTGGQNGSNANYAYGNDGNDVIIGRDGIDNLFGGAGADIFSPGSGADYIVGGAGLDTLNYHESASGVWLNLTSQTGLLGDAAGDSWRGIEKLIGSSHDDTFIGVGGAFMAGMEGNDTFHLKNGDVAFGGAGADSFYIDVTPGQPISVGIIDLDPNDRIFINGAQFNGFETNIGGTRHTASMTGAVLYADTPSHPMLPETMSKISLLPMASGPWGPIPGPWGPSPGSGGASALDIYVAGYTGGDGGFHMMPMSDNVWFPFMPSELF